ncbi:hypothetical protein CEXT_169881 [Caerostris extrusa]|uniref:Uncharacterized protein n=1 Tax=Caerostris extrusa TaxID=172846 RepID=A0AAV4W0P7_CAEEX|nr:hypothetical protein CEXT_169881 [Caerostris extrusa]
MPAAHRRDLLASTRCEMREIFLSPPYAYLICVYPHDSRKHAAVTLRRVVGYPPASSTPYCSHVKLPNIPPEGYRRVFAERCRRYCGVTLSNANNKVTMDGNVSAGDHFVPDCRGGKTCGNVLRVSVPVSASTEPTLRCRASTIKYLKKIG